MRHASLQAPAQAKALAAWRWAALGGCAGVALALLAGAPAHWLGTAVGWATQQRVQLLAERGTVWSGSANLALTGGPGTPGSRSLPGRVQWRWGLAWPGLSLQLSADCCTTRPLQWQLLATPHGPTVRLQDQQTQWPMGLLAGLGAPWNTLEAEGRLQWQSQGLQLHWQAGRLHWQGRSEVLVQQLTSRLSTLRPMGSYRLLLQGDAGGTPSPELTLSTLQGPLRLQGQGQWNNGRLRFAGEASAEEGFETALSNLLNIVGRREGSRSLLSLG